MTLYVFLNSEWTQWGVLFSFKIFRQKSAPKLNFPLFKWESGRLLSCESTHIKPPKWNRLMFSVLSNVKVLQAWSVIFFPKKESLRPYRQPVNFEPIDLCQSSLDELRTQFAKCYEWFCSDYETYLWSNASISIGNLFFFVAIYYNIYFVLTIVCWVNLITSQISMMLS